MEKSTDAIAILKRRNSMNGKEVNFRKTKIFQEGESIWKENNKNGDGEGRVNRLRIKYFND